MTNEEIQKLIEETRSAVEAGVTVEVKQEESMAERKLREGREKLQVYLDKMNDSQRERVNNAMQVLRVFKPAYYRDDVYEYQCVLPLTETLISLGSEIGGS